MEVEAQLTKLLPKQEWTLDSDTLILHGRRICKPKPLCDQCHVRPDCDFYKEVMAPQRRKAPAARKRR